jgi:hypothetical protein
MNNGQDLDWAANRSVSGSKESQYASSASEKLAAEWQVQKSFKNRRGFRIDGHSATVHRNWRYDANKCTLVCMRGLYASDGCVVTYASM